MCIMKQIYMLLLFNQRWSFILLSAKVRRVNVRHSLLADYIRFTPYWLDTTFQ
jgi:hypothetical protein